MGILFRVLRLLGVLRALRRGRLRSDYCGAQRAACCGDSAGADADGNEIGV